MLGEELVDKIPLREQAPQSGGTRFSASVNLSKTLGAAAGRLVGWIQLSIRSANASLSFNLSLADPSPSYTAAWLIFPLRVTEY